MILPRFEYKKARSTAEAIDLYGRFGGRVCYLAGGTDLVPRLKLRLAMPKAVVDIKAIRELDGVTLRDGYLVVGANTTLFGLRNSPEVGENFPVLAQSLDATSCETLQMRGTIGGNLLQDTRCLFYNKSLEWRTAKGFCRKMGKDLCNVLPGAGTCFSNYCGDNAPSLIALWAHVTLVGPDGERSIPVEGMFSHDGKNPFTLRPGEILSHISIPLERTEGAYEKLRVRGSIDYPLAGVAVARRASGVRICVSGIGPAPRLYELPDTTETLVKEVVGKAQEEAKAVANATLSAAYRKRMVGVLARRAIIKVGWGDGA